MGKRKEEAKPAADDDFVAPEFNQEAFARREIAAFYGTAVAMGLGLLLGAASGLALGASNWAVDGSRILLVILGIYASSALVAYAARPLFARAGAQEAAQEPKDFLGYGFWMFTTWLAVWILFLNFA
ncbi:MAG TPA: hypothetical protein VM681_00315 [Candidatus Thermoplasmatota archaeon]|nr:hypothetical protein [Candidatus Thermoplasmatota archaeon]